MSDRANSQSSRPARRRLSWTTPQSLGWDLTVPPENLHFRTVASQPGLPDHTFGDNETLETDFARQHQRFWLALQTKVDVFTDQSFRYQLEPPQHVWDAEEQAPDAVLVVRAGADDTRVIPIHAMHILRQAGVLREHVGCRIIPPEKQGVKQVLSVPSHESFAPLFDFLYFKDLSRLRWKVLEPDSNLSPPHPVSIFSDEQELKRLRRIAPEKLDLTLKRARDTQTIVRDWNFYNKKVQTVVDAAAGLLAMVQMSRPHAT